ncbi:phospholipase D family protein [Aureimonas frigidaquae]|uniref:Phospholipase D n=1 Tax=Aureimonas frigidaquae TaxID=424757 RepID=A0A0P0Z323_9HYPH|nr:phospholipase D family protein [Aureimonas frigidaquae]BAT28158.1 phospholipase D/transphosphatidylase precursor [Aureimonas frigidaquae]
MPYLAVALVVIIVFVLASLAATYAYGRFAEAARGKPSHALPRSGPDTEADRIADRLRAGREAGSGLALIASNLDAFAVRVLSARAAGRSLDAMYYIWGDDLTGRLMLGELLGAADRGVRVRLLVDDIGVSLSDRTFLAVDRHPNIEVRMFNPTHARDKPFRRGVEMALRMLSVNRRMHNKAFVVDGQIAIVGGRNISDAYFDAGENSNFRDMDIVGVGELAGQTERVFDEYWNSGVALPVRALAGRRPVRLGRLRGRIERLARSPQAAPYIRRLRERISVDRLVADEHVFWTQDARIVADPPQKASGGGGKGHNRLLEELVPLLAASQRQVNVTSPYFIPGDRGADFFAALVRKGVRVRVLTNSLAATDVAAVHGGYAPYRESLLIHGVELYELKPTAGRERLRLRGSSRASLHTKAFTSDGEAGFVGSLNFDPRSVSLNTEMGVLFAVPGLVQAMDAIFEAEIQPEMSYALSLDADGALEWRGRSDGLEERFEDEPEASFGRKALATLVGLLPLESQL